MVKRVTTMFILVFLIKFYFDPSCNQNYHDFLPNKLKVTAFLLKQVSVLNLEFVPLFLLFLKDLYKSCCCTFIVTPLHLRLGF